MAPALRRVVRTMPQIAVVQIDDTPQVKKTKVAAYARVSTEKEEQEDSFERQVEHYTHLIESNPEWTNQGGEAPGLPAHDRRLPGGQDR